MFLLNIFHRSRFHLGVMTVFFGNSILSGLSFFSLVLAARYLNLEQFGVFSTVIALTAMAVQFMDFGLSTSYSTHVGGLADEVDRVSYYSSLLKFKIIFGLIISIAWYFCLERFEPHFKGLDLYYLKILMGIAFLQSTINFLITDYNSKKKHLSSSIIMAMVGFIRISGVVVLIWALEIRSVNQYILVYLILPYILPWCISINYRKIFSTYISIDKIAKIYRMGAFVFLSSVSTILIARCDVVMIQNMLGNGSVALYSAAISLAQVIPLITGSIVTVILPQLSTFIKEKSEVYYVKKIISYKYYVGILVFTLTICAPLLLPTIFGIKFLDSIGSFQILAIAFVIGLLINPLSLLFYHWNKASYLVAMNFIQLCLNVAGNLVLIPKFGIEGAAMSTTLVRLAGGLFILVYVIRKAGKK